jgi:hypothetical protein
MEVLNNSYFSNLSYWMVYSYLLNVCKTYEAGEEAEEGY